MLFYAVGFLLFPLVAGRWRRFASSSFDDQFHSYPIAAMDQSNPHKWYMWRFNDVGVEPDRLFGLEAPEETFERHDKRSDFDEPPEEEAMYFVPRLRKRSDAMRSPVGKRVTANVRFGSPLSSSGYILDYSLEDVDNMREVARSIRESSDPYDKPLRSVKVRVPYLRLFYT